MRKPTINNPVPPKPVMQSGFIPLRCFSCNALLLQASKNAVISVVCGRCGSHIITHMDNNLENGVDKKLSAPHVIGSRG